MTLTLLMLLAGCGEAPVATPAGDAGAVLHRTSIALRGRVPSIAERERVEADPAALDALLDELTADPALGARVADAVAPVWRTRVDRISFLLADRIVQHSLGEEPLRMIQRIVDDELPYTELVTGDWTMADESAASVWPVAWPPGQTGWQVTRYTDGRPSAGVLSGNAMWWRYRSTAENLNRGRANAIARVLLCSDYTKRPVHFERTTDVFDTEALLAETRSNPACANCHSTLDPIGSYLFGFWYFNEAGERPSYDPAYERIWVGRTDAAPSFYGEPGYRLDDLGDQIANDPRFITCAVKTVWEGLLRRPATLDDDAELTDLRETFLAADLSVRALVRAVLDAPAWREARAPEGSDNAIFATPTTLAMVIKDLTGFVWRYEGIDMLADDEAGVRTLAGGADGVTVTAEANQPNATTMLVNERLAESAALWAVEHDAERPIAEQLFAGVNLDDDDEAGVRAGLSHLFRRVLGRTVATDAEEITLLHELWRDAERIEREPRRAWAVTTALLLRDPDLGTY